jgi:hypothetical protein
VPASYEKGEAFLRVQASGLRVLLITVENPRRKLAADAIDEVFYMPDGYCETTSSRASASGSNSKHRPYCAARRVRSRDGGRCTSTFETLMGDDRTLLSRQTCDARESSHRRHTVPDFVHVLNYDRLREFASASRRRGVKPRSEAASMGIKKIAASDELWPLLEALGDRQSFYVLEQYLPGDIYHVDSVVFARQVMFAVHHQYGHPPMDVSLGGIFTTRKIPRDSADAQALDSINREVIDKLGLVRGVTHAEFIKGRADGRFYFLEIAARVGGANIAETVEAATGLNLWAEWAKVEIAGEDALYELPPHRDDYAGVIISLARQEYPDTSTYDDPEIVYRLNKLHHAGLVVASQHPARVEELLVSYSRRFYDDFYTTGPPLDKPTF